MEKIPIDGLTIFFPAEERATAEMVRQVCEKTIPLIRTAWGLKPPQDVRVYVLTSSWMRAIFHAAPWCWRPLMFVSLPVWYPRGRRLWRVAGGWQQTFGRRRTVCVKVPRLLTPGDSSLGDRLFMREDDSVAKVQQITCHELTHAFTTHLQLPAWLNEGMAMVTAERVAGRPMVRLESLALLAQSTQIKDSLSRQAARSGGTEAVVALYARGYWRTRYLEETRPGLLRDVLAQPRPKSWDRAIAATCNGDGESFWLTMDVTIATYFKHQGGPPQVAAMTGEDSNAEEHAVGL